jgi:hypothetical protein
MGGACSSRPMSIEPAHSTLNTSDTHSEQLSNTHNENGVSLPTSIEGNSSSHTFHMSHFGSQSVNVSRIGLNVSSNYIPNEDIPPTQGRMSMSNFSESVSSSKPSLVEERTFHVSSEMAKSHDISTSGVFTMCDSSSECPTPRSTTNEGAMDFKPFLANTGAPGLLMAPAPARIHKSGLPSPFRHQRSASTLPLYDKLNNECQKQTPLVHTRPIPTHSVTSSTDAQLPTEVMPNMSASAPSRSRRLLISTSTATAASSSRPIPIPTMPRFHVEEGSRPNSSTGSILKPRFTTADADEEQTTTGCPVLPPASAEYRQSTDQFVVTDAAVKAAVAPILAHAIVSAERTRALHEHLSTPKLMTADEYRAQYPSFDSHNSDYMAYRARWLETEKQARESAMGVHGALPRVSSRSLLCTPQRETRTLDGAVRAISSVTQPLSLIGTPKSMSYISPLSGYRTLSPSLVGSFGYRGEQAPVLPLGSSPVAVYHTLTSPPNNNSSPSIPTTDGCVSISPVMSGNDDTAPLFLPAPVFHEEVPAEFIHKNSVMAFMLESSRPTSLRNTPIDGFLVREEHISKLGLDIGTPSSSDTSSPIMMPSPVSLRNRRGGLASTAGGNPNSPLLEFQPRNFTSIAPLPSSQEIPEVFVPVLPASHTSPSAASPPTQTNHIPPVSSSPNNSASTPRLSLTRGSLPPLGASSRVNNSHHGSPLTSLRTLHHQEPGSNRSQSDGTAPAKPRRTMQVAPALDMLPEQQHSSSSSASPINQTRNCKELQNGNGGDGIDDSNSVQLSSHHHQRTAIHASHGSISSQQHSYRSGKSETSLPGTPSEEDGPPSMPASSLAGLRSPVHIASITRTWQDGMDGSDDSPSSGFFPSLNGNSANGGHCHSSNTSSSPSPTANPKSLKRLSIYATDRLRVIKSGISSSPGGSTLSAQSPSSASINSMDGSNLPPAHSPNSVGGISTRRLRLSHGTGGFNCFAGGDVLCLPRSTSPASSNRPHSPTTDQMSPSMIYRRRLLVQLAASNVAAAAAAVAAASSTNSISTNSNVNVG